MNLLLRSVLVGGLGDIVLIIHGGYGSSIEASTAADAGLVVGHYDIGSQFGVSKFGLEYFKGISYKESEAVFLASPDTDILVERALIEYQIKRDG